MTHGKSCTTSAECKTGISAVLVVTSGLGLLTEQMMNTDDKDAHLRLLFLLYIILVYMIVWLFGAIAELVATQLLKL